MTARSSICKLQEAEFLVVVDEGGSIRTVRVDLSDAQWAVLERALRPSGNGRRGRPWRDSRAVLNGILWVLRTGASWRHLPHRYPSYQTCHRRLQLWQRDGTLMRLLGAIEKDMRGRRKLKQSQALWQAGMNSRKKWTRLSAALTEEGAATTTRARIATVFVSPRLAPALRPIDGNFSESASNIEPSQPGRGDR
ncbi:MAG TPA: transposase [Candidatus Acidoferrales bacterium]|nr:transposase [Candidatus Acidoferrales bacterium]